MGNNRNSMVLIAAILAVVATAMFLVAHVTTLFVAAYIFALIGVAGLLVSGLNLLGSVKSYPWAAAIPQTAVRYTAAEIIVSAIIVVLEQAGVFVLPLGWFALIHIIILAFFAIHVIVLNAGKNEIERVGEQVRESTFDWKMIIADIETLAAKSPLIKPLFETVKYSDPVSNPKLAEYDEKILDGTTALEQALNDGDNAKVNELIVTLQRQIKDRNNRAKLLKRS